MQNCDSVNSIFFGELDKSRLEHIESMLKEEGRSDIRRALSELILKIMQTMFDKVTRTTQDANTFWTNI